MKIKKAISFMLLALFLFSSCQREKKSPTESVQDIIDKSIDNKYIHGITLCISINGEMNFWSSGNIKSEDQYFIASVTKLYTASVIFRLSDSGELDLNDYITKYLPEKITNGLHIYNGTEYSKEITIKDLLSNTSGLPDYFEEKGRTGISIKEHAISGKDTLLDVDRVISITKEMHAHFPPGEKGKAFYSDSNFQLLGMIIEEITGGSISEAYKELIFEPLELADTYLYTDVNDSVPEPIYYKSKHLNIPGLMSSFRSDGGIVSTAYENMVFLKAFFAGELFRHENINLERNWNKIYSPFHYGTGIAKFKFPGTPELIGHPGASGSFAYYNPKDNIYITGTINQVDKPQLPYKIILKVLNQY